MKLYGNNVEKATVKVYDGEEANDVVLAGSKVEENDIYTCRTLELSEKATTSRVRIEFHKDNAEPFELEIPYVE